MDDVFSVWIFPPFFGSFYRYNKRRNANSPVDFRLALQKSKDLVSLTHGVAIDRIG